MAPPPGQTKRILEPDEPDRVTRQKATMAAATDHQESLLGMDFESSVEMRDEFSPMDEETTLCMDESGTVCVPLRMVHLLLTGMMSSMKKNSSLCFNQASSPSLLLVHFANGSDHVCLPV